MSTRIADPSVEEHIVIDGRAWVIPASLQTIAVQNDKNSEVVYIDIPRYFDGIDRAGYDVYLRTINDDEGQDEPVFGVNDLEITSNSIIAKWSLQPPQTSYPGTLRVYIIIRGDNGYQWSTYEARFKVKELSEAEPVVPALPGEYESWLENVSAIAAAAEQNAANAAADRVAVGEALQSAKTYADWDLNDPEGLGYVRNRTHYVEREYETVFDQNFSVGSFLGKFSKTFNDYSLPIEGDTLYRVTIDGTVYSDIVSTGSASAAAYLGDPNMVDPPIYIEHRGPRYPIESQRGDTVIRLPDGSGTINVSLKIEKLTKETVYPLDEKYIPDAIARKTDLGTATAPSDWSINDPDAPGYVKNRTHWVDDPVQVTILPETTVEIPEDNPMYLWELTGDTYAIGSEYTVSIDGVEYTTTAYEVMGIPCIGNPALAEAGEDTGEPFFSMEQEGAMALVTTAIGTHTLAIWGKQLTYHPLDYNYLPPIIGRAGEGKFAEVFNNTLENTASGYCSHAEGDQTTASGNHGHAEGNGTTASGDSSHAEGDATTASGGGSHAEGSITTASGVSSHAEGSITTASGYGSHAEGQRTTAEGDYSHAEGNSTTASGYTSHAEGSSTIAGSDYQHVQGKGNIEDGANKYAHIVGNGSVTGSKRSNAHTLDWDGNAWYAGTVEGTALILKSPNGTRYQITVSDTGALTATALS